jgi:hypothetical protein
MKTQCCHVAPGLEVDVDSKCEIVESWDWKSERVLDPVQDIGLESRLGYMNKS